VGERDCPELDGVRVLIVDDDADSREMLAMVLERSGAKIDMAESAAEAVAAFQSQHPHALLLDLGLPDEDGFQLLKKLRGLASEGEDIPAIALTGYGSAEDQERSREGGFQAHLVKPVALSDVIASVVRVLQSRRP